MLTSDSFGNILASPQATYVSWPVIRSDLLKEFHHLEWCVPKGFRECQLFCSGQEVQINGAHDDAVVVNKGSLCQFILGELPDHILQATAWFPNYERFAKTAMIEHIHGKGEFVIRLHGVGRRSRLIVFPYRDILHPNDLWLQLVGNRLDCGIDVLNFLFLSTLKMPLEPEAHSGTFHILEYDCQESQEVTCVFVTHLGDHNHYSFQGTTALRVWPDSSLKDIHRALCRQLECAQHGDFLFHVGVTRIANFHDVVDGMVLTHTVCSPMPASSTNHGDGSHTRSRSPRRVPEHDDSTSLLQSIVTRIRHRLQIENDVNDQIGAICIGSGFCPKVISSGCWSDSFSYLTHIVASWPDHFLHPQQWTRISQGNSPTEFFFIKDVSSPVGVHNIPVEVVHLKDGKCVQDSITIFQLRLECDWPDVDFCLQQCLADQSCVVDQVVTDHRTFFRGDCLVFEEETCYQFVYHRDPSCVDEHTAGCDLDWIDTIHSHSVDICTSFIGIGFGEVFRVDQVFGHAGQQPNELHDSFVGSDMCGVKIPGMLPQQKAVLISESPADVLIIICRISGASVSRTVVHIGSQGTHPFTDFIVGCRVALLNGSVIDPSTYDHIILRHGDCITVLLQEGVPPSIDESPVAESAGPIGANFVGQELANFPAPQNRSSEQPHDSQSQHWSLAPDDILRKVLTSTGEEVCEGEAPCPGDLWCADPEPTSDWDGLQNWRVFQRWLAKQHAPWLRFSRLKSRMKRESPRCCDAKPTTQPIRSKVQLELCHVLPHGETPHEAIGTTDSLHSCLQSLFQVWTTQWQPIPDGVVVHPNTALALWDQAPFDQLTERCFFLYVDGSAHTKGAGWSVILVVTGLDTRGHMRSCLLGTLHGKVTCNELDRSWLGAQYGDNIDAEIQAATIALAWLVANRDSLQGQPVFLCPDLQYSEGLIGGSYSPHQDRQTTTILANLGYIATSYGLQVLHAKAHSGWEWNELADIVAKFAADESAAWIPPETVALQQLIRDQTGMSRPEWWPGFFPSSLVPVRPPITGDASLCAYLPQSPTEPALELVTDESSVSQQTVDLTVLTYNVLSLRSDATGDCHIGREADSKTHRIDSQASDRKIDILCLQETRTEAGRHNSDHYAIFASGAHKSRHGSHLGCEIWFCKNKGFDTNQAQVVHADERLLFVRIGCGDLSLLIVSAHALHLGQGHNAQDVQKWWSRFQNLLYRFGSTSRIVIGIDANARLATETTDSFGMLHAEDGGLPGQCFEKFAIEALLVVPSTFSHFHQGDSWTWRHPRGNTSRIDYVLIDRELAGWCQSTTVIRDFDAGFAHEDHCPVMLQMRGTVMHQAPSPRLDERKMADPDLCAAFQAALITLPVPLWVTDVDQHAAIMRRQIHQLSLQFFARTEYRRYAKWMSEGTSHLIQFKRQVLQALRHSSPGPEHDELKQELRVLEKIDGYQILFQRQIQTLCNHCCRAAT